MARCVLALLCLLTVHALRAAADPPILLGQPGWDRQFRRNQLSPAQLAFCPECMTLCHNRLADLGVREDMTAREIRRELVRKLC